jgi:predicted transcriptional regulator
MVTDRRYQYGDPKILLDYFDLEYISVMLLSPRNRGLIMPEDQPSKAVDLGLAAKVVTAYVSRNQIASGELPALIQTIYQSLQQLGKSVEPIAERTPAVSIRRSVHRDYVICLDCGWRGHMLRRHLMTRHGLSAEQYRARWSLRPEHQLTAPEYSERRSAMAKRLGLGRGRQAAAAATESPAPDQTAMPSRPRRQRRARAKST